jgi:superoxide reductase
MEPAHFIEFIQLMNKEGLVICEKQLKPGDKPEAVFCVEDRAGLYARELCNLHGLWRS